MIDKAKQNDNFDALEGLTNGQEHFLLTRKLVALTEAKLNYRTARTLLGKNLGSPFMPRQGEGRFGGRIIVSTSENWEEAEQIAKSRGWGEKVIGFMVESKNQTHRNFSLN